MIKKNQSLDVVWLSGPALSRCNRCSCIGLRAMVFG